MFIDFTFLIFIFIYFRMALPQSMTSNATRTSTSNKYTIMSEINVLIFELLTRSCVSEFIKKISYLC